MCEIINKFKTYVTMIAQKPYALENSEQGHIQHRLQTGSVTFCNRVRRRKR